jgi:hypothetical protein
MGGGKQPMSQQSSGPAGPGSDDWPDGLWPDDDDDGVRPDAWPAPSMPPGWPGGSPRRGRLSPANLAVVAVVGVVIGAGIALAVQVFSGSPAASAPSSSQPRLAPGQRSGGNIQPGQGGPPGQSGGFPGGQAGTVHAFIVGTVLKVSATSITIGGPGHTITAAVTGSTRVSGRVTAIAGLKAGDQVSAQISERSSGKATVVAIQYPAQLPAGGVPGG